MRDIYGIYDKEYIERLLREVEDLKEIIALVKKEKPDRNPDILLERLIDTKRRLRREYRQQDKALRGSHRYINSGEDGYPPDDYITYTEKCFENREEAEAWADEEWEAGQIYADYSPTGQWFISSIRIAHIEGNRWKVRIRESLDC